MRTILLVLLEQGLVLAPPAPGSPALLPGWMGPLLSGQSPEVWRKGSQLVWGNTVETDWAGGDYRLTCEQCLTLV